MLAILPEGELAKRAKKHNINWPDLAFFASAEEEPFVDVEVITLQQHCLDNVIPDAIEFCSEQNIRGDQDTLIAAYIAEHNDPTPYREFVATHHDPYLQKMYITVGVNKSTIDDDAIDHALTLLEKIDSFNGGDYIEFGRASIFTPSAVSL